MFGIEFSGRHERNGAGLEFAVLETLEETCVSDVDRGIEVGHGPPRDHLVDFGEVGIFPVLAHALAIGVLDGCIVDTALQIAALIWIEGLVEVFVDDGDDAISEGHLVVWTPNTVGQK